MAPKLYIDFETRSAADLKRTGVHKYAKHPSTDILCTGWCFDDEPVGLSERSELTYRILDHVRSGGKVIAHNAPFELAIWNLVGVRKYGWPKLLAEQTDCTMARCLAMALPAALDRAAAALGLEAQKDMSGKRVMMKLSQPKKDGTWYEKPEDFEKLYAYCMQDVEVERQIDKRVLALHPLERKIWLFDQRVNWRGVHVDLKSSLVAIDVVDSETKRLDNEIQRISENQISTHKAHVQVKDWLAFRGISTPGVAKNDVTALLSRDDLPSDARRVLEIRQEAAKASTAKLKAIVDGACADRRLRGLYQYHGASTGRWAGRRVQTQNFPRPTIDQDEIDFVFKQLSSTNPVANIETFVGPPMTVISDCLRGFINAAPEKELVAMDFSAIEARVVAWLAGEESVLEIFRTHGLIYEFAASLIYGVPLDRVTKEQRQVGKVAVLALGYQGGVGAFQQMAKGYGVKMAPAFPSLWTTASAERRDRAVRRWNDPKSKIDKSAISREEWLASELTKLAWRETHPNIVAYWNQVQAAAMAAVATPGTKVAVGPESRQVVYKRSGSFLFCRLPSGRALCYPYPEIKEVKTPWDETVMGLRYMAQNSVTGKWERNAAYGGLLVENLTQAVARDLLAEAMLRLENKGFPVVLHVHDEVVTEIPKSSPESTAEEIQKIVAEVPAWAAGLPISAEGWRGERYRK